jgi:hypothetical protein
MKIRSRSTKQIPSLLTINSQSFLSLHLNQIGTNKQEMVLIVEIPLSQTRSTT